MIPSLVSRLAYKWRREGVRGLALAALGRTVYRHLVLSETDLRDIPLPRCELAIEVRRLRPEDVPAYFRSRSNSPEEILRRMERGSECYAAWHAGEIVSAAWWHPGEAWIEELDRRFLLRPDELYCYDGWTIPRLRGRNLTPARAVLTMRMLREQDFVHAVTVSLPENRPIHRAWRKMG